VPAKQMYRGEEEEEEGASGIGIQLLLKPFFLILNLVSSQRKGMGFISILLALKAIFHFTATFFVGIDF
jgi:hypothetical protein